MRSWPNRIGVRLSETETTPLLLFLYNSGARADEAAKLTIDNLQLGAQSSVRLHGKGNKFRTCPLWPVTATSLSRLIVNRGKSDAVFLNRINQPLTRFGIHRLVTHYAELASKTAPSLATKRVSPHTIRHYLPRRTMSGSFGCNGNDLINIEYYQGCAWATRHSQLDLQAVQEPQQIVVGPEAG